MSIKKCLFALVLSIAILGPNNSLAKIYSVTAKGKDVATAEKNVQLAAVRTAVFDMFSKEAVNAHRQEILETFLRPYTDFVVTSRIMESAQLEKMVELKANVDVDTFAMETIILQSPSLAEVAKTAPQTQEEVATAQAAPEGATQETVTQENVAPEAVAQDTVAQETVAQATAPDVAPETVPGIAPAENVATNSETPPVASPEVVEPETAPSAIAPSETATSTSPSPAPQDVQVSQASPKPMSSEEMLEAFKGGIETTKQLLAADGLTLNVGDVVKQDSAYIMKDIMLESKQEEMLLTIDSIQIDYLPQLPVELFTLLDDRVKQENGTTPDVLEAEINKTLLSYLGKIDKISLVYTGIKLGDGKEIFLTVKEIATSSSYDAEALDKLMFSTSVQGLEVDVAFRSLMFNPEELKTFVTIFGSNLINLDASFDVNLKDATELSSLDMTYNIKDIAEYQCGVDVNVPLKTFLTSLTASDINKNFEQIFMTLVMGSLFKNAEIEYADKSLMPRLLSAFSTDMQILPSDALSAIKSETDPVLNNLIAPIIGAENSQKIAQFVDNPGKIKIHASLKEAMPLFALPMIMEDPKLLEVSITSEPGKPILEAVDLLSQVKGE